MVFLQNGSQKRNNTPSGVERDTDLSEETGPRDPSGFCGLQEEYMSVSQGFSWPVSEKNPYICVRGEYAGPAEYTPSTTPKLWLAGQGLGLAFRV